MTRKPKITLETTFTLGGWTVDPPGGRLIGDGEQQSLEPRVMKTLVCLAEYANKTVNRDQLIEFVWSGQIVSDDAVQRCISLLRRALGDDAKNPTYILTVPKKGYRMLIFPAPAPDFLNIKTSETLPRSAFVERGNLTRRSITMGISVAVFAALAGAMMLHGTPFAPDRLARQVADPHQTEYARAMTLYSEYDRDSNERAIAILQKITNENSSFAPAYAGLARAYAQRYSRWTRHTSDATEALRLAEIAVKMDGKNANGFWALGLSHEYLDNAPGALDAYKKGHAEAPDIWQLASNIGDLYLSSEQYDDAEIYYARALAVANDKVLVLNKLGEMGLRSEQYSKAEIWFQNALTLHPLDDRASAGAAAVYAARGDHQRALEICTDVITRILESSRCTVACGEILIGQGRYEDAYQHFSRFQKTTTKNASLAATYLLIAKIRTGRLTDVNAAMRGHNMRLQRDAFLSTDMKKKIEKAIRDNLNNFTLQHE